MAEDVNTITRSRAITLINDSIENFFTFYDSYCYDNKNDLSDEQKDLYDQMNEVMMIVKNDENYHNDLKMMPLPDLTEFLLMCKEMVEINDLSERFSYPKGKIVIVDNINDNGTGIVANNELIEKSLEKLELHGDSQIQKSIKEWRNGERAIMFADMSETAAGETRQKNDFYTHYINSNFGKDSAENEVRVAITLAHEFKRKANSNTLTGETRDIILEDTKIIESFANDYGEDIYKKFPEYGILHYIKKIFGESELKEFAEYAFDSTGSYWKVNSNGDLVDDGNISKVIDVNGNELYSGTTGMQGTLQNWLGLENAYETLMKPAGFKWNGESWASPSGKISNSILNQNLTEQQYELIERAANLLNKEEEKVEEEKTEKHNFMQEIMQSYVQSEMIKTKMHVELFKMVFDYFFGEKLKENNNDNSEQLIKKDVDFNEKNTFCSFEIFNQAPLLIPSKTWDKNAMEKENLFATSVDSTKCNMFLPKYLMSISESVYKDIITEENAKASRLNELFSINPKLYKITGNEYDVSKRIPEFNRRGEKFIDQKKEYSAAKKAIIAQDLANESKLVIAYVTDHVAIVTKQNTKYSCYPEKNWNSKKNYHPFQTGDGYSNGIVLDGFPVFLQAGSYTGVVNPGMAMGRNGFTNDEVIYYVYKG